MSEVRKLYPDLCIRNFIADGAMDNYPTYELMYHWNIIPFIPLMQKPNKLLPSCLRELSALMIKAGLSAKAVSLTKTAATPTPKVSSTGAISTAMTLKNLVNVPIHLMEGLSI